MTESAGAVIGLNFGLSYSSIASINPHGRADVIANEDGERQLATRIAFNEDQVYIGNQATPQLVRNAPNVIDRFVGFLGRDFASLTDAEKQRSSSPVIDVNGVPSFKVTISGKEQTLSAHDVAVRYLRALHQTARDFLSGVPIAGAVIALPSQEFGASEKQVAALKDAATEAGFIVLGLIPAAAAALVAYNLTSPLPASVSSSSSTSFREQLPTHPDAADGTAGGGAASVNYTQGTELDRTVLVLDMGGTSTSLTLLAARAGLYLPLATLSDPKLGGQQIDDALVAYFAKEFTKKTKVQLDLASNARAAAKLRNEAEVTKRSLSASNSAQCSVESLAEGIDFSGSVNRMRLDLLAGDVYNRVQERVKEVLAQAQVDTTQVHEVILAGGSSRLSGLVERLGYLFPEEGSPNATHFTASIDSDQVIARGCAVQAQALVRLSPDSAERKLAADLLLKPATSQQSSQKVPVLSRPVGLVVPSPAAQANGKSSSTQGEDKRVVDGKLFVTLFPARTPLPARRAFRLPLASSSSGNVVLSFAEGTEQVRTDKVAPAPRDPEDEDEEDEEEEEEEEEVKTAFVKPDADRLVEIAVPVGTGAKSVLVELVAQANGAISIEAQAGSGEKISAQIAAA
ncbi:Hsp70 protein that interacts with Zuo1p [Tilletia horrida]|nr:Hsp70 protein that interacts with Zuo1p [Tilletia horrida]